MCGIVGYVGLGPTPDGKKFDHDAYDVIIEGLRRLEYRGYDSAGIAVIGDGEIEYRKKAGKLVNLENEVEASPSQLHKLASAIPAGQPTVAPPTVTPTPTW